MPGGFRMCYAASWLSDNPRTYSRILHIPNNVVSSDTDVAKRQLLSLSRPKEGYFVYSFKSLEFRVEGL